MCGPLTREGLLALHRLEDRGARVLLGPHAGQPGRAYRCARSMPAMSFPDMRDLERPVGQAMAAEEVVLAVGNAGVVRVGRGAEAELVRVEALGVLHREAVLQRLAGVAADDVRNAARRVAQQHRT